MKTFKLPQHIARHCLTALILLIAACAPIGAAQEPPAQNTLPVIITPSQTKAASATPTFTPEPSPTATPTLSPTSSQTFTITPSPSPSPTYAILRGEVNVEHVSCFYGPHKSYLYKYGLVGGSNLEIIGRNVDTHYIEIRAIGGTNPCWMNEEWINIKGDILAVQPIDPLDVVLPESPYYGPLTGVTATRTGETVFITWNVLSISPGKDSLQYPYLVEAWLCQDGQLVFSPNGSWTNSIELVDQAGCEDESHARVYGVEKHGYTAAVNITWPSENN
jgi:hypothetical protein